MRLPALITSDLHLTSKPAHEYRWGLFPWLYEQIEKFGIRTVLILGDLTDAKDYHGADLVNRVTRYIAELGKRTEEVIILKGNHDYLKESSPAFFEFLLYLRNVTYVSSMFQILDGDVRCQFLPHCKNPHQLWRDIDFESLDFVFMHQTVNGAVASNGQKMQGELAGDFDHGPLIQIYSGDIHVPQDIADVRYVGSPYHVHFGDNFTPRCLLLEADGKESSLHFETIKRVTLTGSVQDIKESLLSLESGDHVKIRLDLGPDERSNWNALKRYLADLCRGDGIELHGIEMVPKVTRRILLPQAQRIAAQTDPAEAVTRFVTREDLGADVLDAGLEIIKHETPR